jgi:hypothetical protein
MKALPESAITQWSEFVRWLNAEIEQDLALRMRIGQVLRSMLDGDEQAAPRGPRGGQGGGAD